MAGIDIFECERSLSCPYLALLHVDHGITTLPNLIQFNPVHFDDQAHLFRTLSTEYSPDRKLLTYVRVWDTQTGQLVFPMSSVNAMHCPLACSD